jgi:hypothetical protein
MPRIRGFVCFQWWHAPGRRTVSAAAAGWCAAGGICGGQAVFPANYRCGADHLRALRKPTVHDRILNGKAAALTAAVPPSIRAVSRTCGR